VVGVVFTRGSSAILSMPIYALNLFVVVRCRSVFMSDITDTSLCLTKHYITAETPLTSAVHCILIRNNNNVVMMMMMMMMMWSCCR